jgi:hypothetical protein
MSEQLTIRTTGYNAKDRILFYPGPSRCGHIDDGVSLAHVGDNGRGEGGWVISYHDLMRMAKAATDARPALRESGVGK